MDRDRKEYYQKNKEVILAKKKAYYQKKKEEIKAKNNAHYQANKDDPEFMANKYSTNAKWREQNREAESARKRKWKQENQEHVKEVNAKWYQDNKEHKDAQNKKWRDENVEKDKANKVKYYQANKPGIFARRKVRYHTDPQFKLRETLRKRMRNVLRAQNAFKNHRTLDILGTTIAKAYAHIESLFQPGMSWDNHGEWHIDHIIPCASFDLTDPEQQKKCFHYTNLQPLWALDNLSKGAKL